MKSLFIFVLILGMLQGIAAQKCEVLFQLPYGDGNGQLGLQALQLGNQSHEEGYFTLRYGPEAIAVWKNQIVFILDKVNHRVAVLDITGKWLSAFPVASEIQGLAVSEDKVLAGFSPADKWATVIYPKESDTRLYAPASFAALSEVWWQDGSLWGRYGWQSARLEASESLAVESNASIPQVMPLSDTELALVSSESRASSPVIQLPGPITNAYRTGSTLPNQRIALVVEIPAADTPTSRRRQIWMSDADGNVSPCVTLAKPWTLAFSTHCVQPDGVIYEMVIEESGVIIRRWSELQATESRKVREMPTSEIFPQQTQASEPSRTTVNVWFRSTNVVKTMDIDEYLKGVVSQEIYGSWTLTAHKSMAVAARTYAIARYRHPDKSAHVCTTTCCQAWTSNPTPRAIEAVQATSGQYVMRNGSRITEPLYFSHCNGHTRNSENYDSWNYIAYLRSVSCSCGYTSYYGHGVGMCQYGMQAYSNQGLSYVQIIEHYYTGCTVGK